MYDCCWISFTFYDRCGWKKIWYFYVSGSTTDVTESWKTVRNPTLSWQVQKKTVRSEKQTRFVPLTSRAPVPHASPLFFTAVTVTGINVGITGRDSRWRRPWWEGGGGGRDRRNRLRAAGRECRSAASERTAGDALSFPTAVVPRGPRIVCNRIGRVSYALFPTVCFVDAHGRHPYSYDRGENVFPSPHRVRVYSGAGIGCFASYAFR